MSEPNTKKDSSSAEVRMVLEVDGNPVGSLNLDLTRLWPLLNHRERDRSVQWMDAANMRTALMKRLMTRLETHLYRTLGDEMVKAELDVESFNLKAEAAAQAFGRTKAEIEKVAMESGRTPMDFYAFFWDYLLDEREIIDLKKEWKAWGTQPR
jgi:hypothetical protein